MELIQQLLISSEKLYSHMSNLPDEKDRDTYILKIEELLDVRGEIINKLRAKDEDSLKAHPLQQQLLELDKGIRARLVKVQKSIKVDMQQLQTSKVSERKYTNPYASLANMDGTYFDGKK